MRAVEDDCHLQEYPGRQEPGFSSVGFPVVHFLPVAFSLCFECLLSTQASRRYVTHTNTATKLPPPVKTSQGPRQWA